MCSSRGSGSRGSGSRGSGSRGSGSTGYWVEMLVGITLSGVTWSFVEII